MIRAKDNPFGAQRLDAIGYIPQGEPLNMICNRLKTMDCTAAVVGPHGSGKSTLLRKIQDAFDAAGDGTQRLFVSRDVKLPWKTVTQCIDSMNGQDILFFDGANHLPFWRFRQLKRLTHQRQIGLVITSHTEGLLPTLLHCRTNPALLAEIINRLSAEDAVATEQIEALFQAHQGNIRDCLWQLYDEYGRQNPMTAFSPTV